MTTKRGTACVVCAGREHKTRCAGPPPDAAAPPPPKRRRPSPSAPSPSPVLGGGGHRSASTRPADEFDDDEYALTAEQRRSLDAAAWILDELDRDDELRMGVEHVDAAACRAAALARARRDDPRLASFVDRVLVHLGACVADDATGAITFVGVPRGTRDKTGAATDLQKVVLAAAAAEDLAEDG